MSAIETVCSNDDLSPNFNHKKNNNHKMARIQRVNMCNVMLLITSISHLPYRNWLLNVRS